MKASEPWSSWHPVPGVLEPNKMQIGIHVKRILVGGKIGRLVQFPDTNWGWALRFPSLFPQRCLVRFHITSSCLSHPNNHFLDVSWQYVEKNKCWGAPKFSHFESCTYYIGSLHIYPSCKSHGSPQNELSSWKTEFGRWVSFRGKPDSWQVRTVNCCGVSTSHNNLLRRDFGDVC